MDEHIITEIKSRLDVDNFQSLVDAPFSTMLPVSIDLGIIVLLLKNEERQTIDRVALSHTEPAAGAVLASNKPFEQIRIPLSQKNNSLVKALETKEFQIVSDWKFMFIPELTAKEARYNQRSAGVEFSIVQPFFGKNKSGALIFSFLCPKDELTDEHVLFTTNYAKVIEELL